MDTNQVEQALADVISEAVKSERYTATAMQNLTGIKPRTWTNYFTSYASPVPTSVVWAIGEVLGIPGSELMRRAEQRAATQAAGASGAERRRAKAREKGRAMLEAADPGVTTRPRSAAKKAAPDKRPAVKRA